MTNKIVLALALKLENFFLRKSWKVSTVTNYFIDHFIERGIPRDQITYLPNGADTDFLRPLQPNRSLVEKWGLEGKKVVLYVGTHAFYHGLDTLLDTAKILKEKNNIAFLFIGDGPERQRIIQKAKGKKISNVVFGSSPYAEMADLYSLAYVSVALLKEMKVAKGMRLSKIFPSLSCGVPIIYSGEGEAAELLLANNCGLVTGPEDANELASAILTLAEDNSLRDQMGVMGRRFVETKYSWKDIVLNWLAELE